MLCKTVQSSLQGKIASVLISKQFLHMEKSFLTVENTWLGNHESLMGLSFKGTGIKIDSGTVKYVDYALKFAMHQKDNKSL